LCDNFSHLTSSVSRHNNSAICIGNNNIAPFDTYLTNTGATISEAREKPGYHTLQRQVRCSWRIQELCDVVPRNFSHLTSSVSRHNNSAICIGNNNIAPFDTYLTL
jgi:hypothetical protein